MEINSIVMGRTCCMTLMCGVSHKIFWTCTVHMYV